MFSNSTNLYFSFENNRHLTKDNEGLIYFNSNCDVFVRVGNVSPFYSSCEKDQTKWAKTRQFRSCLVCSKPKLYSYSKIFIGQELTQTDGIDGSRLIYFVSFRLWPRELHKNISSLRGFKASIFHLTSLSLCCSSPFSPFFFFVLDVF